MTPIRPPDTDSLSALRRFARPRPRPPEERCELCGAALVPEHDHLIEPARRQLFCSCAACALLFSNREGGRFRRIPRRVALLADFQLSDAQWEALHLPINLAFLFRSALDGRILALYPSPAGATESLLSLESWQELEEANPILREFEPDVEALLVNRVGEAHDYYRAPIDECYKLVGLLRAHWRGLSGGAAVWSEIARFFDELHRRAGGPDHA